MKFDFVPNVCQGETPTYSGKLVISVPKAPERYGYIRESGVLAIYEKMENGVGKEASFDLSSSYDLMLRLSQFVERHIEKVDLVRLEDGLKVTTAEDFMSIGSLEPAVMQLSMMFMKGFEPGKNSAT